MCGGILIFPYWEISIFRKIEIFLFQTKMSSLCSGLNPECFLVYFSMSKDRILIIEAVCAIHADFNIARQFSKHNFIVMKIIALTFPSMRIKGINIRTFKINCPFLYSRVNL